MTIATIILIIIGSFILGTVMGSFGGVLLDRREDLRSMLTGRSKCLTCQHPLATKDLVPLVSYLSTKGKCRYCGCDIPASCPQLELAMGVIFALTTWRVVMSGSDILIITIIAWCLINRALTLLVVHDHRTHYLHWSVWVIGMIIAIGYTIGFVPDLVLTSFWSSIILGAIFLVIYVCGYLIHWIKYGTREQGFGLGDVLTALLIGRIAPLALGYDTINMIGENGILTLVQLVLGYLVISSTVGLLYRAYLWSRGDQEIEIAFIPGMVIGFWIYVALVLQFGIFTGGLI